MTDGRRRGRAAIAVVLAAAGCGRSPLRSGTIVEIVPVSGDAGDATAGPLDSGSPPLDADAAAVNDGAEASCAPECFAGQESCDAGAVAYCTIDDAGCLTWGEPLGCPSGEACIAASDAVSCAPVAPPRPIAPLSTATSRSSSPAFRWALAEGDDGAQVDICKDRRCTQIVTTFAAEGSRGTLSSTLAPGVYYWRLHGTAQGIVGTSASVVWELFVGARSAPVATAWGTTLDVDGDGFADVLVGAPGPYVTGTAYLYRGGPSRFTDAPTPIVNSDIGFGASVASAGDVDGDGFDDAVISSRLNGVSAAVYVYRGGPGGLSATPISLGTLDSSGGSVVASVMSAGDVDGDGFADVLVVDSQAKNGAGAAYLHRGGERGSSSTAETLDVPYAVAASAADVNGDGFGDVVVGMGAAFPRAAPGVAVLLGSSAGLSSTPLSITAPSGSKAFGTTVGTADVNGDGYADVLVGDYGSGNVYVYLGGAAGPSSMPITLGNGPESTAPGGFGAMIAGAGDVNGDGFDDIAISAGTPGVGDDLVYVYLGGSGGPLPASSLLSIVNASSFGASGAGAGDVDGDGFGDLVIGAPTEGSSGGTGGAAYVFFGGTPTVTLPATTLTIAGGSGEQFGASVQ